MPDTAAVVTADTVTFTPATPIDITGDYAIFAFARPGLNQAAILHIPPEIIACVDQWLATQFVVAMVDGLPTVVPKYKHLGDLVRQREIVTTFAKILEVFPPASVLTARAAVAVAAAAAEDSLTTI